MAKWQNNYKSFTEEVLRAKRYFSACVK